MDRLKKDLAKIISSATSSRSKKKELTSRVNQALEEFEERRILPLTTLEASFPTSEEELQEFIRKRERKH